MAQVLVRNLDDAVVGRLKARAAAAQRPLEAELRLILEGPRTRRAGRRRWRRCARSAPAPAPGSRASRPPPR
jgi:plasmid stability protein